MLTAASAETQAKAKQGGHPGGGESTEAAGMVCPTVCVGSFTVVPQRQGRQGDPALRMQNFGEYSASMSQWAAASAAVCV